MRRRQALLVLADGTTFEGEAAGALPRGGVATGEVVFNTAMSGYQEVITDPSYAGQVVAFTYPHIGNYGVTPEDDESVRPWCRGVVVRDLAATPSSWRAAEPLEAYLVRHGVPAMTGVDTRRLTRHVRETGSMPCAFGPVEGEGAASEGALLQGAKDEPGTEGADLVSEVSTARPYRVGNGPWRVVAYDFGIKAAMVRSLAARATVQVLPAHTPAAEALALCPDGILLSNGPGDPAALPWAAATVGELLGRVPVLGICLGHQLLAAALGGRTTKLAFGHHGANHPVRELAGGAVQITSQNHNYAVDPSSLDPARVAITHLNLNDGVVEGLRSLEVPAFGVQYHPEAGPGPHEARLVFDELFEMMGDFAGARS